MRLEALKLLEDVRQAAQHIEGFVAGKDLADYCRTRCCGPASSASSRSLVRSRTARSSQERDEAKKGYTLARRMSPVAVLAQVPLENLSVVIAPCEDPVQFLAGRRSRQ